MKILILSFLVLAVSCDTPTRARFPSTSVANAQQGPASTGTLSPGSTSTGTTTGATTSPGFENCTLAKNYTTADLGSIGICKSTLDETQVRFISSMTNTSNRTCIIPTYRDSTGSSTYLGDPQCTYTQAEQIITGRLYKNRSGFAQFPINGAMVLREQLLVEYFGCMDSYAKYIQYYCPANPTYAPCVQGAAAYRNTVCTQFKQKYPNNYLDIAL